MFPCGCGELLQPSMGASTAFCNSCYTLVSGCCICSKSFTSKSNATKHSKLFHGGTREETLGFGNSTSHFSPSDDTDTSLPTSPSSALSGSSPCFSSSLPSSPHDSDFSCFDSAESLYPTEDEDDFQDFTLQEEVQTWTHVINLPPREELGRMINETYDNILKVSLKTCSSWSQSSKWMKLLDQTSSYKTIYRYGQKLKDAVFQSKNYFSNDQFRAFFTDIPTQIAIRLHLCHQGSLKTHPRELYETLAFQQMAAYPTPILDSDILIVGLIIIIDDYQTTRFSKESMTAIYGEIANVDFQDRDPFDIAHISSDLTMTQQNEMVQHIIRCFIGNIYEVRQSSRIQKFVIRPFAILTDMPQRFSSLGCGSFHHECTHCQAVGPELSDIFRNSHQRRHISTGFDSLFPHNFTQQYFLIDIMHSLFLGLTKRFFDEFLLIPQAWNDAFSITNLVLRKRAIDDLVLALGFPIPKKYKTQSYPRFSKSDKGFRAVDWLIMIGLLPSLGSLLTPHFQEC